MAKLSTYPTGDAAAPDFKLLGIDVDGNVKNYLALDIITAFSGGPPLPPIGAPVVDSDFMTALDSTNFVLTRATTGTYFNSSGVMTSAAINAPRFDHDSFSHVAKGLLLEHGSTNLIRSSLLNGTNMATQTVAIPSQSYYTLSFYGSGTITFSGVHTGYLRGSSSAQRTLYLFEMLPAGNLTLTVSGTVIFAQLEENTATSFIPTTAGADGVRAADFCLLTGPALAAAQGLTGTVYLKMIKNYQEWGQDTIYGCDDTTGAYAITSCDSSDQTISGSLVGDNYYGSAGLIMRFNGVTKVAGRWGSGYYRTVADGRHGAVNDTHAAIPVAGTTYGIAGGAAGASVPMWIQHVQLYDGLMPDADMETLTVLDPPTIGSVSQPRGAAVHTFSNKLYDFVPTTADIAPSDGVTNYRLYSDIFYNRNVTPYDSSGFYMNADGLLTIPLGAGELCGQTRDSTQGVLPYLDGTKGFYVEFTVSLDSNHTDTWMALWMLPREHDTAMTDHYGADPAAFERFAELDVHEGNIDFNWSNVKSFGMRGCSISHFGIFDSGLGMYPSDQDVANQKFFNSYGWIDQTVPHIYGAAYRPGDGMYELYLDDVPFGRLQLSMGEPICPQAALQHFYIIIGAQSFGAMVPYNLMIHRVQAWQAP